MWCETRICANYLLCLGLRSPGWTWGWASNQVRGMRPRPRTGLIHADQVPIMMGTPILTHHRQTRTTAIIGPALTRLLVLTWFPIPHWFHADKATHYRVAMWIHQGSWFHGQRIGFQAQISVMPLLISYSARECTQTRNHKTTWRGKPHTHIHTCMQTFLPKSWASHLNSHLLTVRFSSHTQMQCSPGRLIDYTVYFLVQWHIVSEILLTPMFVWFQGTLNHQQQQPRTHQVSAFAFHSPTLFVNRIDISLTYLMHDKLLIWSILMRCTFEWTQIRSDPHGNACIRTNMWTHCAQLRTQLAWHESQA